ncbi:MAG: cell wall hydrolase [Dysosmobacter sp.]
MGPVSEGGDCDLSRCGLRCRGIVLAVPDHLRRKRRGVNVRADRRGQRDPEPGQEQQLPNTVEGVIFDRKDAVQFEPVSNGRVYLPPTSQSVEAAKRALDGEDVVGSALYFYAPALSQGTWINANRPYQQTIGCHRFYR